MNFAEETKKRYEELTAKRDRIKTELDTVNNELRPLITYMKEVGIIPKKKRSRPQPAPPQG